MAKLWPGISLINIIFFIFALILSISGAMTLQQLRYIVAIDTYRSFGKAAEACGLTQSTLSLMAIMQTPPMYSAVSVGGKKLYDLARQGLEVEREARPVTIHSLTLEEYDVVNACGLLTASCSKGTYIRTLIDDIGKALGCGAALTSLRRTEASGITIDRCMTLAEAQEYKDNGILESKLLSLDKIFEEYPAVYISENQAVRFSNGATLALERLQPPVINGVRQSERLNAEKYPQDSLYRVYSRADNKLHGLGVKKTDQLRVKKRF